MGEGRTHTTHTNLDTLIRCAHCHGLLPRKWRRWRRLLSLATGRAIRRCYQTLIILIGIVVRIGGKAFANGKHAAHAAVMRRFGIVVVVHER